MKVKILFSALLMILFTGLNAQQDETVNGNLTVTGNATINGNLTGGSFLALSYSVNDLNTTQLTAQRQISFSGGSFLASNRPNTLANYFTTINLRHNTSTGDSQGQIAMGTYNSGLFFRSKTAGTWQAWKEAFTTDGGTLNGNLNIADNKGITLNGTSLTMAINYNITDGSSTIVNRFQNNAVASMDLVFNPDGATPYLEYRQAGSISDYFRVFQDGSIGTSGDADIDGNLSLDGGTLTMSGDQSNGFTSSRMILNSHDDYRGSGTFTYGQTNDWFWGNPYTDHSNMWIISRANSGTGQSTAQKSNALLTLDGAGNMTIDNNFTAAGNITTKKLRVTVNPTAVPDYVFQPGYDLKTLAEVEAYIKANAHLPGIASASEIGANGQDVGAMQLSMLEKIEELTLYTINQEKAIKTLEKENKELKAVKQENKALKSTLEELLKRVEKLENKANTSNDQ